MRNPSSSSSSSLKQEFLKKWTMGLQASCRSSKEMSIMERKKAIKLSADVAMACARNGSTCWSRSIIANASTNDSNRALINCITTAGSENNNNNNNNNKAASNCPGSSVVIISRSKKMAVLRSRRRRRRRRINCHDDILRNKSSSSSTSRASCIAKKLVKKRRELLKSLVPGGESMDHCSLIAETLDYIISLRAQVDVMRRLTNASMLLSIPSK